MTLKTSVTLLAIAVAAAMMGCSARNGSIAPFETSPNVASMHQSPTAAYLSEATTHATNSGLWQLYVKHGKRSWLSPAAKTAPLIYVGMFASGSQQVPLILVYDLRGKHQQPIGMITLESVYAVPGALTVDDQGTLWVAATTGYSGVIYAYPKGAKTPSTTLVDSGGAPGGIAVDASGSVYVANETTGGSGAGNVVIFAKGATTPTTTLTDPNIGTSGYVVGAAVDKSGNVLITDQASPATSISEFKRSASGYTFSTLVSSTGLFSDVAIDNAGKLAATNSQAALVRGGQDVSVYTGPQWKQTSEFGGSRGDVQTCAFGRRNGKIVLAASYGQGGVIGIFSYPDGKLINELVLGPTFPLAVAISPPLPVGSAP